MTLFAWLFLCMGCGPPHSQHVVFDTGERLSDRVVDVDFEEARPKPELWEVTPPLEAVVLAQSLQAPEPLQVKALEAPDPAAIPDPHPAETRAAPVESRRDASGVGLGLVGGRAQAVEPPVQRPTSVPAPVAEPSSPVARPRLRANLDLERPRGSRLERSGVVQRVRSSMKERRLARQEARLERQAMGTVVFMEPPEPPEI